MTLRMMQQRTDIDFAVSRPIQGDALDATQLRDKSPHDLSGMMMVLSGSELLAQGAQGMTENVWSCVMDGTPPIGVVADLRS